MTAPVNGRNNNFNQAKQIIQDQDLSYSVLADPSSLQFKDGKATIKGANGETATVTEETDTQGGGTTYSIAFANGDTTSIDFEKNGQKEWDTTLKDGAVQDVQLERTQNGDGWVASTESKNDDDTRASIASATVNGTSAQSAFSALVMSTSASDISLAYGATVILPTDGEPPGSSLISAVATNEGSTIKDVGQGSSVGADGQRQVGSPKTSSASTGSTTLAQSAIDGASAADDEIVHQLT